MEIKSKFKLGEKVYQIKRDFKRSEPYITFLGEVDEITLTREGNKCKVADIYEMKEAFYWEHEILSKEEAILLLTDARLAYIQELKDEIEKVEGELNHD